MATDTSISGGVLGVSDTISAFALRQATSNGDGATIRVDNLLIDQAFTDVVGVPEPGSMAFLALGLLGFGSRRNRR